MKYRTLDQPYSIPRLMQSVGRRYVQYINYWVSPKFTDTLLSPDSVFRTLPD